MSGQLEFGFIEDRRRRDQLLCDLEFPGRRNATLLAALLREVDRYGGNECYLSQASLGRAFKVSEKTIGRAMQTLEQMGVLAVRFGWNQRAGRMLNHYGIVWPEVERLVAAQAMPEATQVTEVAQSNRTVEPTNRTVEPDQSDICDRPIGHLEGTNRTSGCPPITERKGNNNVYEGVVVSTESLVGRLERCGVAYPQRALERAGKLGVSAAEVVERIERFEGLAIGERDPARLYNWLSRRGSWESECRGRAVVASLGQRGDAWTREQVSSESVRAAIVRAGRAAGASEQAIAARCQLAGVVY